MIRAIRNIELALSGDGIKQPSNSERKNIPYVRKSIVAARKILKGDIFSVKNLTVKRPGNGISPMQWDEIIGKTAIKDFEADDLIEI
jgi:N,N'-diacetyllegionaminate synthase